MQTHFEVTLIPRDTGVIERFQQKVERNDVFKAELSQLLGAHKITLNSLSIKKEKEGKGKKNSSFEGFKYKKYRGEIKGTQKKFLRSAEFNNEFTLYMLFGAKRDGYIYRTHVGRNSEEIRQIGATLYDRVLEGLAKKGPIDHSKITRSGTISKPKMERAIGLGRLKK